MGWAQPHLQIRPWDGSCNSIREVPCSSAEREESPGESSEDQVRNKPYQVSRKAGEKTCFCKPRGNVRHAMWHVSGRISANRGKMDPPSVCQGEVMHLFWVLFLLEKMHQK